MPYLDSQLADKHKANCKKPKAKRLYVRGYDNEKSKKQILIPYGIVCPSCKVIIFLDSLQKEQEKKGVSQQQQKPKPKPSTTTKKDEYKEMLQYEQRRQRVADAMTDEELKEHLDKGIAPVLVGNGKWTCKCPLCRFDEEYEESKLTNRKSQL